MKIYCCKELRKKSIDNLLDLLSSYVYLKKDICRIIKKDIKNESYYIQEYLYCYELNIRKIKNELKLKTEFTF